MATPRLRRNLGWVCCCVAHAWLASCATSTEPHRPSDGTEKSDASERVFVDTIVCADPDHGIPSLRFRPMPPADPPGTLHFAMQQPELGDEIAETYAGGIACLGTEIRGSVVPRLACQRTVCARGDEIVACDGAIDRRIEIELTSDLRDGLVVIEIENATLAPFYGGRTRFRASIDPGTCTRRYQGCVHDVCTPGPALESECNACAALVCAADPFCCDDNWDSICVGEARALCRTCRD